MYFAVCSIIGLAVGQPTGPGSDYYPLNSRNIKIPIRYEKDRKAIRQVKLYVARNGENTWYQEGALPPDRDFFTYTAKEDGIYWFTMVEEDLQGRNIPTDLTRTPPDLKVLVDTVPPRVQFTNARKNGEEVIVEWSVDDRYPDENATRVHFRPSGSDGPWQEVILPAGSRTGVKFASGTPHAVDVRVTAYDLAGNKTEAIREVGLPAEESRTSLSPDSSGHPASSRVGNIPASGLATPKSPALNASPASSAPSLAPEPAPQAVPVPSNLVGPLAPPLPSPPAPPVSPPQGPFASSAMSVSSPSGSTPGLPTVAAAGPATPPPAGVALAGPVAVAATESPIATQATMAPPSSVQSSIPESRQAVVPAGPISPAPVSDATANLSGPTPVAVWTSGTAPSNPTVEVNRVQYINYWSFDMAYEVEARGPSGISRLDLWVTRDDGKTWMKWSQYDGKTPTIRVNLNVPSNPQPEGSYGFRVVPVSGAGLSEREPVSGDVPDLRVVVDVTPPTLELFQPVGDPANPDTLVIQWRSTDRNFGEDPITIEWSDRPTGPWQPAAAASEVVSAASGTVPVARRLPNTGQFSWRVPAGLPPRVYLKVTAKDAAGNVREVITRDPILIDLVKPRAKISGIITPAGTGVKP